MLNKIVHRIYGVTIYDNGFCWKPYSRDKNIDDYKKGAEFDFWAWLILIAIIVIF